MRNVKGGRLGDPEEKPGIAGGARRFFLMPHDRNRVPTLYSLGE